VLAVTCSAFVSVFYWALEGQVLTTAGPSVFGPGVDMSGMDDQKVFNLLDATASIDGLCCCATTLLLCAGADHWGYQPGSGAGSGAAQAWAL
jgi:hypothetical protein